MKVFIWKRVEECTDNYHSEGGVVVIADDVERAMDIAAQRGVKFKPSERPDSIWPTTDDGSEEVFIFPDAGCC